MTMNDMTLNRGLLTQKLRLISFLPELGTVFLRASFFVSSCFQGQSGLFCLSYSPRSNDDIVTLVTESLERSGSRLFFWIFRETKLKFSFYFIYTCFIYFSLSISLSHSYPWDTEVSLSSRSEDAKGLLLYELLYCDIEWKSPPFFLFSSTLHQFTL